MSSGGVRGAIGVAGAAGPGLEASPIHEVLIDKALLGWKEYELELLRDKNDNVVIICTIENMDPMGIHTGDSSCNRFTRVTRTVALARQCWA